MSQERTIDSKNAIPMFEAGKKKFEELVQRRTRLQVELEASKRQFLEGSKDAELEFGTSKLPELRELYKTKEATKLQDILEFVMGVDELEAELKDIEEKAA
jgi:hypothetical protein